MHEVKSRLSIGFVCEKPLEFFFSNLNLADKAPGASPVSPSTRKTTGTGSGNRIHGPKNARCTSSSGLSVLGTAASISGKGCGNRRQVCSWEGNISGRSRASGTIICQCCFINRDSIRLSAQPNVKSERRPFSRDLAVRMKLADTNKSLGSLALLPRLCLISAEKRPRGRTRDPGHPLSTAGPLGSSNKEAGKGELKMSVRS